MCHVGCIITLVLITFVPVSDVDNPAFSLRHNLGSIRHATLFLTTGPAIGSRGSCSLAREVDGSRERVRERGKRKRCVIGYRVVPIYKGM